MKRTLLRTLAGLALASLAASPAMAASVVFTDPIGDDHGPGNYTYPTDAVYVPGSFDLTEFKVEEKGGNLDFSVSVNSRLADPWGMGVGFAVQMVFIFIDTDGVEGSGYTDSLPGLNAQFAPGSAWERVVILSPQQQSRVLAEARVKVADKLAAGAIVVPRRTTGRGKTISARVSKADIGSGDVSSWGYQVVVQSNEGFPDKADLLTRKVNEYEGQHRFGGGNDGDCDPHVMDILAGEGKGAPEEIALQHEMLAYECGPDGESVRKATLEMVRK
jgi:carbohydrate-binding DOMON domain-containing protein